MEAGREKPPQNPESAMAAACGRELEAFLGCRCHVSRYSAPAGQCSKLLCQELEADIRQCSQRNLQSALRVVETRCQDELDSFVRCFARTNKGNPEECIPLRIALADCAEKVLGERACMFTSALSNPEGLVTYRVASGKTVVD